MALPDLAGHAECALSAFTGLGLTAAEQCAIQSRDPLLIPGVFQIEPYARRVFEDEPGISQDEIETRVTARLRRKELLDREDPPTVLSLIDEGVLHRPMGSAEVMHQQLCHLLEMAHHPQVIVQIVPYEAQSAVGLEASFTILKPRREGMDTVYVDSVPFVRVVGEPSMVKVITRRYDALRAIACSKRQSLKMIEEVMGKWI